MNTITIELCKEDRQRLDEVIAFLGLIAGELKSRPVSAEAVTVAEPAQESIVVQAGLRNANAAEHPVDAVSPHGEPEPVTEPAAAEPKYTQQDILAIVQRLIAPGSTKRAQAKAIVNDYAEKISAIPADKYNEVMDRLTALEKEAN